MDVLAEVFGRFQIWRSTVSVILGIIVSAVSNFPSQFHFTAPRFSDQPQSLAHESRCAREQQIVFCQRPQTTSATSALGAQSSKDVFPNERSLIGFLQAWKPRISHVIYPFIHDDDVWSQS